MLVVLFWLVLASLREGRFKASRRFGLIRMEEARSKSQLNVSSFDNIIIAVIIVLIRSNIMIVLLIARIITRIVVRLVILILTVAKVTIRIVLIAIVTRIVILMIETKSYHSLALPILVVLM